MKYQALSPDNLPINCEGGIYSSFKKAKNAILEWTKNYQAQGYYSQICSNGYNRRISINELPDYCSIIKI